MPPRFYTSPYKNALAAPAKREGWWSEIPVSTSTPSDSTDLIKAGSDYWIAQGNSSGSLVLHSYEAAGKLGGKAPQLSTGCRIVQSFEVSPFVDLLAVGSDNGHINVFELPQLSTFSSDPSAAISPSPLLSLLNPTSKSIDTLAFHPTASSLLLASSAQTLSIYDIESQSKSPMFELDAIAPSSWSAQWSGDGKCVSATGKDGKLRLWDVRTDSNKVVAEVVAHPGVKASRHVHLPNSSTGPQILTTGFSRSRDREYSLFDCRYLTGAPVKTHRVDSSTGVLVPLVDKERSIVYLAGRGDMSMRWVEIGGPAIFTEGSTPFPSQIAGAALVPPHQLDLMKAEINRLVVLTQDAVVPVPINVPRRQYIDFHSDLYPEVSSRGTNICTSLHSPHLAQPLLTDSPILCTVPAQSSKDWLEGKDAAVETYKPDPAKPFKPAKRSTPTTSNGNVVADPSETKPEKTSSTQPTVTDPIESSQPTAPSQPRFRTERSAQPMAPSTPVSQPTDKSVDYVSSKLSSASINDTDASRSETLSSTQTASPASSRAHRAATSTSSKDEPSSPSTATVSQSASNSSKAPFNPGWSRSFLLGKTPLKPDYFDVHDLSVTMSADVELLKANSEYFFFPLSGPGGRLAVHPLASKGRLPVHIPALVSGSTTVNFEVDPFDSKKVFVACDDDSVRVFELPGGGIEEDFSEVSVMLKDSSMVKITEIRHHPSAKNVLLTVSDDRGSPKARIWGTESGKLLLTADLPAGGVSSAAWSPDGSRIAFSTKKKQICILDPRNPTSIISCPAHESLRPAVITWASNSHIVSTGFTRSSSREVILYKFDSSKLEQVGKQILDVSPSLLIPFVDIDTKILLAYARGERSCVAYEINFDSPSSPFTKLPSFDHPTLQSGFAFFPKTRNDVKEVEIVKSLRLTPGTVEAVSFTVPRMKTEFFQDDIFVPTRNREKPSMTAEEWIAGKNTPLEIVNLQPSGMKPLSQAPAPAKVVSTRSKIKDDGLTDSQRENQYMDRLFESAQDENEEEDDEPQIGRSRVGAPSDDEDW
ncbi:hypothetical protein JCM3765_006144 [Sporobolomyces pararoseus]